MSEVSFTFNCNKDLVQFSYNYRLVSLDSLIKDSMKVIKLYTSSSRVSFENGRFFDAHNLIVRKGKEAEESIKGELQNVKDVILDGLNKVSIEMDLPTSLIKRYVDDLINCPSAIKPMKYLDFEISEIGIELNKIFFDRKLNQPGDVIPQKILKVYLKSTKGCTRLTIKENSRPTLEYSTDCEMWTEDSLKTLSILSSLHPTILEVKEIVDYLKKMCRA